MVGISFVNLKRTFQVQHTAKYFNIEYLHTTATESTDHLKVVLFQEILAKLFDLQVPKVLVHGEPYASNIFVSKDGKSQVVSSVIDWTGKKTPLKAKKNYKFQSATQDASRKTSAKQFAGIWLLRFI